MLDKLGKVLGDMVFEPEENQKTEQSEQSQNKTTVPSNTENKVSDEQQKLYNSLHERLKSQVFTRTTVFVQFSNALKSLEPVIADIPTRYKAAFAMMSSSGVTKEALLNALNVHTSDLTTETSKFNDDMKMQMNNAVSGPNTKIEQLNNEQNNDRTLIQDIQKRMSERSAEVTRIQTEMATAKNKIAEVSSMFTAAEEAMKQMLSQESQNIKIYLQ